MIDTVCKKNHELLNVRDMGSNCQPLISRPYNVMIQRCITLSLQYVFNQNLPKKVYNIPKIKHIAHITAVTIS